ncbi:MAG: hydrogenase [Candidatus Binatus sp.]|jgi:Ni,Fe-hydrogenase III large subunit|uniref:hydrogenase large subunit n=1 Tax=Candidatus Binatus sp. TaxID=2811406 RepID=UPI003D11641D
MAPGLSKFHSGEPVPLRSVPDLSIGEFRTAILSAVNSTRSLAALFGMPAGDRHVRLIAVVADSVTNSLSILSTKVGESYPCLTLECPQAHWFEREIAEQWQVHPDGHPWLKPIRFHAPYRTGNSSSPAPVAGVTDFFAMAGPEVHEVAVGPVHAGIIEPGHFRFQCHGEDVFHLEISLGYQHRGVERALVGGPGKRTIHLMETLCGDTSIGHATAYCEAIEALGGTAVSARAQVLRGVALELERLANHTGDLGALAGDVGYLPAAAYCGRIRGNFLNLTAELCGSRFGRGLIRPGGVGFDVDKPLIAKLQERLAAALKDVEDALGLLWDAPSVQARFEHTGTITRETCEALGIVGPAARACGIERDIRQDFPSGIFRFAQIPISKWHSGDVFARAWLRWLEIQRSGAFVREQFASMPDGPILSPAGTLPADHLVVSFVEGWRGEICHVAITDANGRFAHYKIVDPSFHNWMGLAMAMRNQQVSDFPLCNKSFNLSYCGHDL